MNHVSRFSARFSEEGAAFAELERETVRAMQTQLSKENAMSEEHTAPVDAWDAIAADYDRFVAPGEALLARNALELAELQTGEYFLDVAAGTGGLSLPAARLGARVVATDWAPRMIERFDARVREEGLADIEGRVMDCHKLDFADDTFDVSGSMFGVMLVPDQASALREMARVTRPGGRVLVIAYGSPAKFEALQVFIEALKSVDPEFPGLPDDPPPLEFQVADPTVLRQRLTEAGLGNVIVHTNYTEEIEIGSGRQLWDWCLGGNPIPGMLVSGLNAERQAAFIEKADELVAKRANGGSTALLTADLNIGIGIR